MALIPPLAPFAPMGGGIIGRHIRKKHQENKANKRIVRDLGIKTEYNETPSLSNRYHDVSGKVVVPAVFSNQRGGKTIWFHYLKPRNEEEPEYLVPVRTIVTLPDGRNRVNCDFVKVVDCSNTRPDVAFKVFKVANKRKPRYQSRSSEHNDIESRNKREKLYSSLERKVLLDPHEDYLNVDHTLQFNNSVKNGLQFEKIPQKNVVNLLKQQHLNDSQISVYVQPSPIPEQIGEELATKNPTDSKLEILRKLLRETRTYLVKALEGVSDIADSVATAAKPVVEELAPVIASVTKDVAFGAATGAVSGGADGLAQGVSGNTTGTTTAQSVATSVAVGAAKGAVVGGATKGAESLVKNVNKASEKRSNKKKPPPQVDIKTEQQLEINSEEKQLLFKLREQRKEVEEKQKEAKHIGAQLLNRYLDPRTSLQSQPPAQTTNVQSPAPRPDAEQMYSSYLANSENRLSQPSPIEIKSSEPNICKYILTQTYEIISNNVTAFTGNQNSIDDDQTPLPSGDNTLGQTPLLPTDTTVGQPPDQRSGDKPIRPLVGGQPQNDASGDEPYENRYYNPFYEWIHKRIDESMFETVYYYCYY
jgi:hypothetical protein